jgi:hypothetical protein
MIVSIFLFFFTSYLAIKEYFFSTYYQYLLDYLSGSEDDDPNFVVEEPHETQENDSHVIDSDMVLSSSNSEESSLSGNIQEDCSRYCYRLQHFHKDAFYSAYLPEWEKAKKSSHLISQEKYDEIIALLRTKRQKRSQLVCSSIDLLTLCVGMLRDVACTATGTVN